VAFDKKIIARRVVHKVVGRWSFVVMTMQRSARDSPAGTSTFSSEINCQAALFRRALEPRSVLRPGDRFDGEKIVP